MNHARSLAVFFACVALGVGWHNTLPAASTSTAREGWLSPTALAASPDGRTLYVACATGNRVLRFDAAERKVTGSISLPGSPSGAALNAEGSLLYVTCAGPESKVCVVDLAKDKVARTMATGHTAMAPVLSPDGKTLFVCNRFDNNVEVFDTTTGKSLGLIAVRREPAAADITPDGRFLLVANFLHDGGANDERVAARLSIIDTTTRTVAKELTLPDGSGLLNDLRVSPDGKYAVVTHVLSRFRLPATQVDRGWMNCNALTIVELGKMEILNTLLLDNVDSGAANPWGVTWTKDSASVLVCHAGTHEVSIIDFPGTLARLAKLPAQPSNSAPDIPYAASRSQADVPNDLAFLVGLRQRLRLPPGALGPRAIAVAAGKAFVANYFSDSLTVLDLPASAAPATSIPLGPAPAMTQVRQGEIYFHDASLCFQGWQSCATCHPGGARVDAMNWDLLNDGIGNPKNTRSLLLAHKTPPAMSMGVRETAENAVRAGIRHILFTVQPEGVPEAIDAYLKALQPVPSPHLVNGHLSPAAKRGEKLFKDRRVGCAGCHPAPLFTDLQSYDVGTCGSFDKPTDRFDTPTLVEVWRTAPYLHDGSAATVRDVLTTHNPKNEHGTTSNLTSQQIDDLLAYVLSL